MRWITINIRRLIDFIYNYETAQWAQLAEIREKTIQLMFFFCMFCSKQSLSEGTVKLQTALYNSISIYLG